MDVDPEFEAQIRAHRAIVEQGKRRLTRLTHIAFFSVAALAALTLLINPFLGLAVLWVGWGALLWPSSRSFDRWWSEAMAKPGVDVELLQELAIESGLMHQRSSFLGRWQARSLARVTASVRALPNGDPTE